MGTGRSGVVDDERARADARRTLRGWHQTPSAASHRRRRLKTAWRVFRSLDANGHLSSSSSGLDFAFPLATGSFFACLVVSRPLAPSLTRLLPLTLTDGPRLTLRLPAASSPQRTLPFPPVLSLSNPTSPQRNLL